jgi:hypothetical protein
LPRQADTDWIDDLGGVVTRDAAGKVTAVDLRATWITDTDLRKLNKFPGLTRLDLSLTHITDQGMQELKNMSGIVDLNLHFAEYVTDEGLAAIKGWRKLKRLNLHGTKISDTSLEHISGHHDARVPQHRLGDDHRCRSRASELASPISRS